MNTQRIREVLEKVEYYFEMAPAGAVPDQAFSLLVDAVKMLVAECEKEAAGNARTANVASCLANGIQPD